MNKKDFRGFQWRIKTIGFLSHHDLQWKEIFIVYGFEWKDWWDNYCEGLHSLIGSYNDDWKKGKGLMNNASIFGKLSENLFIKWLFSGKREYLLPFYNWFVIYMNRKKKEKKAENNKTEIKIDKKIGYIYLLKSNSLYKIGRAKYLKNRIKTYRTENPFGIKVIFKKEVNDYLRIEKELLNKFKSKKVKGEWFDLTPTDIKSIKKYLLIC